MSKGRSQSITSLSRISTRPCTRSSIVVTYCSQSKKSVFSGFISNRMVRRKSGIISTMTTMDVSPRKYVSLDVSKPSSFTIFVCAILKDTICSNKASTFFLRNVGASLTGPAVFAACSAYSAVIPARWCSQKTWSFR